MDTSLSALESSKVSFISLGESDKLLFLEWLHREEPHKWEFATMCPPLRKFHDGKLKREDK